MIGVFGLVPFISRLYNVPSVPNSVKHMAIMVTGAALVVYSQFTEFSPSVSEPSVSEPLGDTLSH